MTDGPELPKPGPCEVCFDPGPHATSLVRYIELKGSPSERVRFGFIARCADRAACRARCAAAKPPLDFWPIDRPGDVGGG